MREHKHEVINKTGLSGSELGLLLSGILSFISLIPSEGITLAMDEAKRLISHRDPEDAVFLAAALSLDAALWSDDRDFEVQKKIRVLKTKDVKDMFFHD